MPDVVKNRSENGRDTDTEEDIKWKILQNQNDRKTKESMRVCSKKGLQTIIGGSGFGGGKETRREGGVD